MKHTHHAADRQRAERHRQAGRQAAQRQAWDLASREFETAARLAPGDWLMWVNLARAQMAMGRLPAAIDAARKAFELDRTNLIANRLLTECLIDQLRPEEAVTAFEQLDPATTRDASWYASYGQALFLSRRPADAVGMFFKSLSLDLQQAHVHYRLGVCFKDMNLSREAGECFRTAVTLDNGIVRASALSLLVHETRQACDWRELESDTHALLDAIESLDESVAGQLSPFVLLALDVTPQLQRRMGERRVRALMQKVRPLPAPGPRKPGPIRIGYLSCDFMQHATAVLMTEMLEARDRERFEVHLYSHSPDDGTALGQRIRQACEHFHDVSRMEDAAIAQAIRADGIDILVDLKGHTRGSRFEVCGYRPAPVQVAWLGYPATTGADFLDYIVGDEIVTPLAHADRYSEHIAQLPRCYQPNDGQRPLPPATPRSELGLPEDAVVLCCFNQTYKLSPQMLDVWSAILNGAPQTVLWMLSWDPTAESNLRREFAARGIPVERVFFAPRIGLAGHIARLRSADLLLDTWPCNAHTTASDALWAGVPVLTVPGETFASRVAASLVTACGMPDLACADAQTYVAMAIALAHDRELLQALHGMLDERRPQTPLFDARGYARDFEALLTRMHERHLAGLPPVALPTDGAFTPVGAG